MKVAICQLTPVTGNKEKNSEKMKKFIEKAAKDSAELVIFPELALTGYNCGDNFFNVAETLPGESSIFFTKLAVMYNIYIIYGFPEKTIDGVLYNSAVLIGPEGSMGSWRKNTLPGHATIFGGDGAFPDRRFFRNGQELEVFETPIGRIGVLICYDIFFPELARLLTLKGADMIVGISGSPIFEKEIFEPMIKVRAMENAINFIYTNLVGKEGDIEYWGGGAIISAGDSRSKIPGTPEIVKASYDKEELNIGEIDIYDKRIRAFFPVLRDIDVNMYQHLKRVCENNL